MKWLLKCSIIVFAFLLGILALVYVLIIIAERPRTGFQKHLKKRASAQELQAWATRVLAPYNTNRDPALWIQITNLPSAFRGLDELAPSAYVYADSQARFDSPEL
jgi:hypothetical protein